MLDKQKVVTAVDHVRAAADLHAPVLDELLREMDGISATSEWNEWTKRDPDTAEWLGWYVFEVRRKATGDRDWLRARKSAKEMVAFEQERQRTLE